MTATTYWISNLFIHYWQRPESFWVQSRNHLVFKDIMCIKEIFWWLAIFSHFMTFHHVKLVWKSIMKRNRTPYNRANIMPYESVALSLSPVCPASLQFSVPPPTWEAAACLWQKREIDPELSDRHLPMGRWWPPATPECGRVSHAPARSSPALA